MKNIPLVDLTTQYESLKPQILDSIATVLGSMQLFMGPNTQAFEREFAAFTGAEHAIGVAEGTTALHLALMTCGVGPGDEVITVAHTFMATVEAIMLVGAKPVFVDIDPQTYTMDVQQVEEHMTARTRAIIPVHLYGQPADMDPLMEVAERYGLWVIQDACQAHGALYQGRPIGRLGHMATYSFYYSKNLGAYGEAGMVTTNDDELAQRLRLLRDHGSRERYQHEVVGMNGRLDEIQAAILRVKLPHLAAWNAQRRANAARYTRLLADLDTVVPPNIADYATHVFHLYVLRVQQRDELMAYLKDRGIGVGIHYPVPCHLQPAVHSLGYHVGDLPVTEDVAASILSLPMYPELTTDQATYIIDAIKAFYAENATPQRELAMAAHVEGGQ